MYGHTVKNHTLTNAAVLSLFFQVWPVLSKVFSKCARDGKIIERCCRCIRFAVRCLGKNSTSFVQPLITEVLKVFFHI